MTTDPLAALQFAAAEDDNRQTWGAAEKACLTFPDRFLKLARELNECRRQLNEAWQERDQQFGFVVRNLITVVENCKAALAQAAPAADTPADSAPALEAVTLASVNRGVLHLLEELGVTPVDLVGHTYDDVVVDGEKIEDPFTVLESGQKGKISEIKVREVVTDLWVRRRHGTVQVVRRGSVNC